ncbi:hypothetical protein GU833_17025 [Photorhabdus akhurstii]
MKRKRIESGAGLRGLPSYFANNDRQLIIPQFLTINGLNNYFVKQDDQLIDLTVMDSWVLNLSHNMQYSDTDRKEIQRQITEQYLGCVLPQAT